MSPFSSVLPSQKVSLENRDSKDVTNTSSEISVNWHGLCSLHQLVPSYKGAAAFKEINYQQNRLPQESTSLLTKQGQAEATMLDVEKLYWCTQSLTEASAATTTLFFHQCEGNDEEVLLNEAI